MKKQSSRNVLVVPLVLLALGGCDNGMSSAVGPRSAHAATLTVVKSSDAMPAAERVSTKAESKDSGAIEEAYGDGGYEYWLKHFAAP